MHHLTIFFARQLREMKAVGHQVVGSGSASHEDIHMMYARFFGGESARVKKLLKEPLGSIRARKMLSQIFQVYYFVHTQYIYIAMQLSDWMWLYVLYR